MAKGFVILCVEGFFFCFFIHSVVTFAVLLLCLIHFSLVHEPPTNCVLYLSVSLCVWCVIQFFFCFLSLLFFSRRVISLRGCLTFSCRIAEVISFSRVQFSTLVCYSRLHDDVGIEGKKRAHKHHAIHIYIHLNLI